MCRIIILSLYIVVVTGLSLLPESAIPIPKSLLFPYFDKVAHFGMYAIFTFLVFFTWPEKYAGRISQFIPLLYVLFWGTVMEILQEAGSHGRTFNYLDIIANTLGFFPGWLAWKLVHKNKFVVNCLILKRKSDS